MRFIPTNLTIHAGDSVEWTRGDVMVPHTVSFLSGGNEPDLVLVEPQQRGPPKFVLNPAMQMPAGGKVYSGKDTSTPVPSGGQCCLCLDPQLQSHFRQARNLRIPLYFPRLYGHERSDNSASEGLKDVRYHGKCLTIFDFF